MAVYFWSGALIGGFLAVGLIYILLDWQVMSRVFDDPLRGKLLAVISAYFLTATLYSMNTGTIVGFVTYLPGAVLVGSLGIRSAKNIQARIDAADETSVFE